MGINRWKSPLALWAEKTGKLERGETSEAAELGTELEDFVARKFAKKNDMKIRVDNRDFTHKEYPYMKAHIDRWIVGSDAILEVKTCGSWVAKGWEGEEIPQEYLLQGNWYMGILGKSSIWFAVLIGGQKYIQKELVFDAELFQQQVDAAENFWENFVLKDTPPMASGGDSDTLLSLFPNASDSIVELEDAAAIEHINSAVEHRLEVIQEAADIDKEKSEIDAKLKQVIGENAGVQTDRFIITWKPVVRPVVDTEKLKADGLYEKYTKSSATRTMHVTARKKT
jgi:putative phage-type endonuclease